MTGSLVIVHDGSYMSKVSKTACSAAFMILCTNTNNRAKGVVAESSKEADNYRGEILGGLLVQLILRAATQRRHSPYSPVQIDCDNMGVVKHGNAPTRKLKAKQPQADILRCLKQQISHNPLQIEYCWVPSHQDDNKEWGELTLRERMNVIVDKLAKLGLIADIADDEYADCIYPHEQIRVTLKGDKVTGSLKKAFSNHWSHEEAKSLFHKKRLVSKYEFELVYWDGVEAAGRSFPKKIRDFVTKQVSKFCGTNRQLSRIDSTIDNVCPSCGKRDESSKHITRCEDRGRRAMLKYSVDDLVQWMAATNISTHLQQMISTYLMSQSKRTMISCVQTTSPLLHALATVQDRLGWDNFVEGRISKLFVEVVQVDLERIQSRLTPEKWCKTFIQKLLQLTHKQWLFRNSHTHYKKLEGLTPAQHELIFEKVKNLMWTDPADLLDQHHHLLQEDFGELGAGNSGARLQWAASMGSAIAAAEHVRSGKEYWGDPGLFAPTRQATVSDPPGTSNSQDEEGHHYHYRGNDNLGN